MMRLRLIAAVLFVCATQCASESTLYILSAPENVKFDGSAPIDVSEIIGVSADVLGVSDKPTQWQGLTAPLLSRPRLIAKVVVDGCHGADVGSFDAAVQIPISQVPSYSGYAIETVLKGMTGGEGKNLAEICQSALGALPHSLSIGSTSEFVFESSHTATIEGDAVVGFSSKQGLTVAAASEALGQQLEGVSYSDAVFVFGDQKWEVTPEATTFILEMATMLDSLDKFLDMPCDFPVAVSLVVTGARDLLISKDAASQQAGVKFVRAFAVAVDAIIQQKEKFASKSVVELITLDTPYVSPLPPSTKVLEREARFADIADLQENETVSCGVDFCAECGCYCWGYVDKKDNKTKTFNAANDYCSDKECASKFTGDCKCAWTRCECTEPNGSPNPLVTPKSTVCAQCEPGFLLSGGRCYAGGPCVNSKDNKCTLDGNFPVMFNIILWFSVVATIALIATCYGIGAMDPGRNSIIYKMTSQRVKTQ